MVEHGRRKEGLVGKEIALRGIVYRIFLLLIHKTQALGTRLVRCNLLKISEFCSELPHGFSSVHRVFHVKSGLVCGDCHYLFSALLAIFLCCDYIILIRNSIPGKEKS